MMDLIYVNVIILSLDLVVVILLYLNQTGISHPIQTFSYALKLKLEFVVLNQLMAVAARGLQRENFEERRYHHSSAADAFSAECNQWGEKEASNALRAPPKEDQEPLESMASIQLTMPSPVLSKDDYNLKDTAGRKPITPSHDRSVSKDPPINDHDESFDYGMSDENSFHHRDPEAIRHKPSEAFSGDTLHAPEPPTPRETSPHFYPRRVRDLKNHTLRSIHNPFTSRGYDSQPQPQPRPQARKLPHIATMRRRVPKNGRDCKEDEEEEEEIGVHMWENRKWSLVMEVPWFRRGDGT